MKRTVNEILDLLQAHIDSRPGLDPRDYISGWNDTHGRAAYRADSRKATNDKHDAQRMIDHIRNMYNPMDVQTLTDAFRAFSGRLSLTDNGLEYCTGQYYPTEYRAAACAVLASAIWTHYRETDDTGETMLRKFRRMFGNSIARRWFN